MLLVSWVKDPLTTINKFKVNEDKSLTQVYSVKIPYENVQIKEFD